MSEKFRVTARWVVDGRAAADSMANELMNGDDADEVYVELLPEPVYDMGFMSLPSYIEVPGSLQGGDEPAEKIETVYESGKKRLTAPPETDA